MHEHSQSLADILIKVVIKALGSYMVHIGKMDDIASNKVVMDKQKYRLASLPNINR